jgi:hypothetical protein
MQSAGVTWTRWWVSPSYSVDDVKRVATIFQAHGIGMLFDVNSGHTSDAQTETALKKWLAQLAPAMAKLGQHHWEIGNEPNIDYRANGYWDTCAAGVSPSAAEGQADVASAVASYVVRLRDAYTVIHQSDPKAVVASAGLSYDHSYNKFCEIPSGQWIAQLEKTDAWKYMDYFGIHPYATTPSGVIAALVDTRRALALNAHFANKPFAISEVGFQLRNQKSQAAYAQSYPALMDALKVYGITTPVFWYDWYDYADTEGYGIVQYKGPTDRVYLPIYAAVRQYQP